MTVVGFSVLVLGLLVFVIGAEHAAPGVTRHAVTTAAVMTWAHANQLEQRLDLATIEAARVAEELQ